MSSVQLENSGVAYTAGRDQIMVVIRELVTDHPMNSTPFHLARAPAGKGYVLRVKDAHWRTLARAVAKAEGSL